MLLRRQRSTAEIVSLLVPAIYLVLMVAVTGVVGSDQPQAGPGEQMPPSAPMPPAAIAPSLGNGELQDHNSHEGPLSAEKRGWADMQHGWGKRGWSDLRSAWGKRGWRDLQSAWGKRDWNSFKGAWGKRSWDNFKGSWGKRAAGEWGGGGGYAEGYPEEEDGEDVAEPGVAYEEGPQRGAEGIEYVPDGYEGKRSWGNLKGAWGKRAYASDDDGLDEVEAELAEHYGEPDKRAWRNFRGSWGKRDPGWHNLKGLWGKRTPASKWTKLNSVWGKRSVGGETGIKEMEAPSGV